MAVDFRIGELHIDKLYLGELHVEKIYVGETPIYEEETGPEVVSITSNLTYFDTGYHIQPNTRVVAKLSVDGPNNGMSGTDKGIFGHYHGWMEKCSYLFGFSTSGGFSAYIGGAYKDRSGTLTYGVPTEIDCNAQGFSINGTGPYAISNANYIADDNNVLWLGAASSPNNHAFTTPGGVYTWYYVDIYEGDTLVHSYRPAKNGDIYCFKDTLTGDYIYANDNTKVTGKENNTDTEGTEGTFIKSLGTYFDLGFTPQPGYKFALDFSIDKVDNATGAGTKGIMGMYDSWPNKDSYLLGYEPGRMAITTYAGGSYNLNCIGFILGQRMQFEYSDRGITQNGVTYSVNSQYQAPERSVWLGTANSNSADYINQNNHYTWYSVKVYDGDTLIYDLKPAYDGSVYCFKDTLSGNYFYANDSSKVTGQTE